MFYTALCFETHCFSPLKEQATFHRTHPPEVERFLVRPVSYITLKLKSSSHIAPVFVHRNSWWFSEGGGKLEYCKTGNFFW